MVADMALGKNAPVMANWFCLHFVMKESEGRAQPSMCEQFSIQKNVKPFYSLSRNIYIRLEMNPQLFRGKLNPIMCSNNVAVLDIRGCQVRPTKFL